MDTNDVTILETANSLIDKMNSLRNQIFTLHSELLATQQDYRALLRSYKQSNPKEFTPVRRAPTRCCRFPFDVR